MESKEESRGGAGCGAQPWEGEFRPAGHRHRLSEHPRAWVGADGDWKGEGLAPEGSGEEGEEKEDERKGRVECAEPLSITAAQRGQAPPSKGENRHCQEWAQGKAPMRYHSSL